MHIDVEKPLINTQKWTHMYLFVFFKDHETIVNSLRKLIVEFYKAEKTRKTIKLILIKESLVCYCFRLWPAVDPVMGLYSHSRCREGQKL